MRKGRDIKRERMKKGGRGVKGNIREGGKKEKK